MPTAAIDNDVILKGILYGLLSDLIGMIPASAADVGVLGAARYVVSARLKKTSRDVEKLLQSLERFLSNVMILEPTDDESKLAAELELSAQKINVNLDAGESILCAVVVRRSLDRLVTGDKRAAVAIARLLSSYPGIAAIAGKVVCLEQLFLRLISKADPASVRAAVCENSQVDRALSLCFSCSSPEVGTDSWLAGLKSYIADLRAAADPVLAAS